jgi:hypothetical protein
VFVYRQIRGTTARDAHLSNVYVSRRIVRHGNNTIEIFVGPDKF